MDTPPLPPPRKTPAWETAVLLQAFASPWPWVLNLDLGLAGWWWLWPVANLPLMIWIGIRRWKRLMAAAAEYRKRNPKEGM